MSCNCEGTSVGESVDVQVTRKDESLVISVFSLLPDVDSWGGQEDCEI